MIVELIRSKDYVELTYVTSPYTIGFRMFDEIEKITSKPFIVADFVCKGSRQGTIETDGEISRKTVTIHYERVRRES